MGGRQRASRAALSSMGASPVRERVFIVRKRPRDLRATVSTFKRRLHILARAFRDEVPHVRHQYIAAEPRSVFPFEGEPNPLTRPLGERWCARDHFSEFARERQRRKKDPPDSFSRVRLGFVAFAAEPIADKATITARFLFQRLPASDHWAPTGASLRL
jgi:hypothetical protein